MRTMRTRKLSAAVQKTSTDDKKEALLGDNLGLNDVSIDDEDNTAETPEELGEMNEPDQMFVEQKLKQVFKEQAT